MNWLKSMVEFLKRRLFQEILYIFISGVRKKQSEVRKSSFEVRSLLFEVRLFPFEVRSRINLAEMVN